MGQTVRHDEDVRAPAAPQRTPLGAGRMILASRVRAPELVGQGGWINTSEPLTLKALRGKVVVLHFFSFGCINCQRVQADLDEVSRRWPDEAVVVGVHSPKFPWEGRHDSLRQAVARLGITHPVLDDPDMVSWQQYGVKGWPTVVVVDARGYVVGLSSGEGNRPLLMQVVGDAVDEAARRKVARLSALPLAPLASPSGVLAFPAKVASDRRSRLAIADTGHDRVLVVELADGPQPQARITHAITGLRAPQGVRLYGRELFICDTGNDRVARVDLSQRPGPDEEIEADPAGIIRLRLRPSEVLMTDVASPWDVIIDANHTLVVAESGRHRLWRLPLDGSSPGVIAGNRYEGMVDGRAAHAELAQPSGLARLADGIAFVDAETSSLRLLTDTGKVGTLIGEGLFDWGLVDGSYRRARMQHPQGLVASLDGSVVYVADTYNSALREYYRRALHTLPVAGLSEPGGLDVLPTGRLVVADTGNHRIVLVDPATGEVRPVQFETSRLPAAVPPVQPGTELKARAGGRFDVRFDVDTGPFHLDPDEHRPVRITVEPQPSWLLDHGPRLWQHAEESGKLALVAGSVGSGWITITVSAAVCGDGVCTTRQSVTRHALTVEDR